MRYAATWCAVLSCVVGCSSPPPKKKPPSAAHMEPVAAPAEPAPPPVHRDVKPANDPPKQPPVERESLAIKGSSRPPRAPEKPKTDDPSKWTDEERAKRDRSKAEALEAQLRAAPSSPPSRSPSSSPGAAGVSLSVTSEYASVQLPPDQFDKAARKSGGKVEPRTEYVPSGERVVNVTNNTGKTIRKLVVKVFYCDDSTRAIEEQSVTVVTGQPTLPAGRSHQRRWTKAQVTGENVRMIRAEVADVTFAD